MSALSPESRIWRNISGVKSVLTVGDSPAPEIPAPSPRIPHVVVIPLLESHTRNRPKTLPSLVPDERSLSTFEDKMQFQTYIQDNGLANLCPEHFPCPAAARFPCVLKRIDLHGGQGIAVAASAEHLRSLLEQPPWQGHPTILQAMMEGDEEIVTHCVSKKGRILWHASLAYTLSPGEFIRSALNNVQSIQSVPTTSRTLRQLQEFLGPLGYTGPCNFNYKLMPNGTVMIMEINPRFGGSLMRPENAHHLQAALSCIIENALHP